MTAYADERVRAQALKARVVGCLAKPFLAEELLECLRTALRRHADGRHSNASRSCAPFAGSLVARQQNRPNLDCLLTTRRSRVLTVFPCFASSFVATLYQTA
jgi:DNA-binding response OmpR family regulator